ncbi:hypothetical protein CD928_19325 [Sphingopyxis sp. GW247-27LB]|nr:hypothetical protein CD928_19325 [Sphingopyxis sp. GW247-27LB]
MRWIAGLLLVLLGGCTMAVSDKPMLGAADLAGAPRFEDGVWLISELDETKPCPVDTAQPVSRWAPCANWAVHRDGQWFAREKDTGIKIRPLAGLITVSGGEIAIIQMENAVIDNSTAAADTDPTPFFFGAFDNVPTSAEKLRSVKLWLVMCGQYRPRKTTTNDETAEEFVRYPGFDEQCRPASIDALRAAAEASRPPESGRAHVRWTRAVLD